MPRPPRSQSASDIYHVSNRGTNRQEIFFGDEGRYEFEHRLSEVHDKFGVAVLAYILMGNHYHLLLRAPEGTLSASMQQAMGVFVRHTNDRIGLDGSLFKSRFYSKAVETDPYVLTATRYIHRNALDISATAPIAAYRWSSYGIYLGKRPVPDFFDPEPVMQLFGGDTVDFARFTEDLPTISTFGPIDAVEIRQMIAGAVTMQIAANRLDDERRPGVERALCHLLLDQPLPSTIRPAVEALIAVEPHTGATYSARYRARQQLSRNPAVGAALDLVLQHLGLSRAIYAGNENLTASA